MVTIDPHAAPSLSPTVMVQNIWHNRNLILQLSKREIVGRYKGSAIGLAWSFFNPILMLMVYTIVFSEIFKARWGGVEGDGSKTQFAVVLFVGMIVLSLFTEVLNRAPNVILANTNYVKRVVFPLEILSIVTVMTALFHCIVSLAVLLIAIFIFNGHLQSTVLLIPIILLPLVILVLGCAWFLMSIGVYVRDVGQSVVFFTTVLTFLAPVFYPVAAVPEKIRPIIYANPLTFIIEQARNVLIWGHLPNWSGLCLYTFVATMISWAGYIWFQKTRKGFADVI